MKTPRPALTMVELVVVVLIVGIMASAAAPRYLDSLASWRTEMAARRIAADLNYARFQAEARSSSLDVEFVVGDESYTLVGLADLDHREQGYTVNFSSEGYACVITAADFAGSTDVKFDWYGQPNNAGFVTVQSGTHTRTVQLNSNGETQIIR